MRDPSGDVCSPRAPTRHSSSGSRGVPAARLCSLPLNTHLSSKKRNSVSLKRWRASALGAAMLTLPCPSPGDPRVASLERQWRVPECRRCGPGAGTLSLGAAGLNGTCRQMSVSPLCQQPGGSPANPGDVARRPLHFFRSGAVFGGRSVTVWRAGEQQGAGKGSGPTLTPQRRAPSLFPAPATHHLIYPAPLRLSYTCASLPICDTCHSCEDKAGKGSCVLHLALPPAPA